MQTTEIFELPYLVAGDLVEDIAGQSKAFVEGVESVMLSSEFRGEPGEQGEPGPPGLPGVNAVPADEAIAAYVNAGDTNTRAALAAHFGDAATAALVGDETSETGVAVRALAAAGAGQASDDSVAALVTDAATETGLAVRQQVRASSRVFNVMDYGAVGDGVTSDRGAVEAAITDASTAGGGTVLFPPGTYYWDEPVRVRSNVEIVGSGATLAKKAAGGWAMFFYITSENATGFGSGARNVTFRNLRLEGNFAVGKQVGLLAANHASGLTVEGCEFVQCHSKGHILDLQGCEDVTVRDCIFLGQLYVAGYLYSECIQLDNSSRMGTSYYDGFTGYDGLACRRVTVERCQFLPLTVEGTTYPAPVALGSHYGWAGQWQEDITVRGCTIYTGTTDTASFVRGTLHFISARRVSIEDNTFINPAAHTIRAISFQGQNSGPAPANANEPSPAAPAFSTPQQCSIIKIRRNTFTGFTQTATSESIVRVSGDYSGLASDVSIQDNSFKGNSPGNLTVNNGATPIDIENVSRVTVTGNEVDAARRVLSAATSSNVTVANNQSSGTSVAVAYYFLTCTNVGFNNNNTYFYRGGVKFDGCDIVRATGNGFAAEAADSWSSIAFSACKRFSATGNSVNSTATANSRGVLVEASSTSGVLTGNVLVGMKTPILIDASSAATNTANVIA